MPRGRSSRARNIRLLSAGRIFRDLLLRPCGILGREGELLRLLVGRCKAAIGHGRLSSHFMVRQLDVSPVWTWTEHQTRTWPDAVDFCRMNCRNGLPISERCTV